MHRQIYVPYDVGRYSRGYLLGYKIDDVFVVIQVTARYYGEQGPFPDSELRHLGTINVDIGADGEFNSGGEPTDDLIHLRYDDSHKRLLVSPNVTENGKSRHTYTMVSFSPPNLRNLEYFTVRPVLLQSTGQKQKDEPFINKLAQFEAQKDPTYVSEDAVLDKVNKCQRIRARLSASEKRDLRPENIAFKTTRNVKNLLRNCFFFVFYKVVSWLLALTIPIIKSLNQEFHGTSWVQVSAWCKQLDLRLRQISYFPVQFLCYYDTSILSSTFLEELELPDSNLRHNINNSNYINLYNSLWLIVNDVLVGTTVYRLLANNREKIANVLYQLIINRYAFDELSKLISWVGSDHPAGFKLNNELGQFLEGMFVWTLDTWSVILQELMKLGSSQLWLSVAMDYFAIFSCCCGFSFIVAAFIDYISLATLHVHYFNIATTKIYHRQMEMLKSLTQLFRGKKYNVLRNRIDSLEEDQFRVDQLLLGTFIFMILVYLLPTTFAFYFLFFCCRVVILVAVKVGEKLILTLNLYPLFVILLKIKNSRRLQGGICFQSLGSFGNCNWLAMENQALTFDEILGNFVTVFRHEGRFKRFGLNFLEGHEVAIKDTRPMKFHYLMLPGNYNKLINVWQNTNVLNYH